MAACDASLIKILNQSVSQMNTKFNGKNDKKLP